MIEIDQQKAEKILNSFQIPVKPQILVEIQQEEAKTEPSLPGFADVISKDTGLSSAVLKAVNSPVFGLNRTITDIKQSVMLLGCKNISNLVSFFQLQTSFNKPSSISNERFWDSSVDTANMISVLIDYLSLKSQCPIEDAYAFGLFRDCGIAIMAQKYADYPDVLAAANKAIDHTFTDVEDQHYPVNHATLGYYVASSWHLPKALCQLILRHHDLTFLESNDVTTEQKLLYAIGKVASNVLSQYKYVHDDAEWDISKEAVLGHLNLSELDYDDLEEDLKEIFNSQFG